MGSMDFGQSPRSETTSAVKEGPPSDAVVRAVADLADADLVDLPPLYEAVDPDALDALFRGRPAGCVAFDYAGYTVTLRENAEVTVQE